MSFYATYKEGQGKQARTFAAVLFLLVAAWGCYSFFEYGNSKLDRLVAALSGSDKPVFSHSIISGDSAMTAWITPSLILAVSLFLLAAWWGRRLLNRPRVADHLIGTELEMRRVKWPTKPDVMRAGSVVVYYTFWLAVIIFVIDVLMNTMVGTLLGQKFADAGLGRIVMGLKNFFSGAA